MLLFIGQQVREKSRERTRGFKHGVFEECCLKGMTVKMPTQHNNILSLLVPT